MQCTTEECRAPKSIQDIDWLKYRIQGSNFKGFENMGFDEWKDMLQLKDVLIIVVGLVTLVYCTEVHPSTLCCSHFGAETRWKILGGFVATSIWRDSSMV